MILNLTIFNFQVSFNKEVTHLAADIVGLPQGKVAPLSDDLGSDWRD